MKIGLDIHGCIDKHPSFFADFTGTLVQEKYEVHILTGKEFDKVRGKLDGWGIKWTHEFSILDYHTRIGTSIAERNGNKFIDDGVWDSSKGEYARRVGLDIHFDNDLEYGKYFPEGCTFVYLPKDGDLIELMRNFLTIMRKSGKV